MAILSDISGPNAPADLQGYLTGYPLQETGHFALGRTWLAPEMERPGCVWTHTVLIDFADLASLKCLRQLPKVFIRPTPPFNRRFYSEELEYQEQPPDSEPLLPTDELVFRAVLDALYSRPDERVFLVRPREFDADYWTLAIWEQQWPRLRRQFRFCTHSLSDRSTTESAFDLQVVPSRDRVQRSGSKVGAVVVDLQTPPISNADRIWLQTSCIDLVRCHDSALRSFLKLHGSSISSGRQAFAPLASAYWQMQRKDKADIGGLIDVLEAEFADPAEAKTLKAVIAELLLENAEALDGRSLEYVWANLDRLSAQSLVKYRRKITRALWDSKSDRLWALLSGTEKERNLAAGMAEWLTAKDAVKAAIDRPDLVGSLLAMVPKLAEEPRTWENATVSRKLLPLIDMAALGPVISAMIRSGASGLAADAFEQLGYQVALSAFTGCIDSSPESRSKEIIREWAAVAVSRPNLLATHLLSGAVKQIACILVLMDASDPDVLQSIDGVDPWLHAVLSAQGKITNKEKQRLQTFLLTRGLGATKTENGRLISYSFAAVHEAAAHDEIEWETWRLIDGRVPRLFFWSDWDKCLRLRMGVVNVFVERHLPISTFVSLTTDEQLFRSLVELASQSREGRAYLKAVQKGLKNGKVGAPPEWESIVADAL